MKKRLIYALSAVLLAGSALTVGKLLNNKFENSVQPAEAAETTSAIIENVDGTDYRVIYYYIDSNWEYGNTFYYTSDSNGHCYKYTTDGENYVLNWFGQGSGGSADFSEIIGDFTAKIYLPVDVKTIRFQSSKNLDSSKPKQRETDELTIEDNYQSFVVTTSKWNSLAGDAGYQEGKWITRHTLFTDYLKNIYYTCTSGWVGGEKGPATLQETYVYVKHTGSDSKDIGRVYQLNSSLLVTLEGISGTFAKVLVSAKSGAIVRFQKTNETNPWKNYRSASVITTSISENSICYVYGNHTDDNEQEVSVGTILNAGDYIFFTPSSNWATDGAGFRVTTFGSGDAVQEERKALTLLTKSVFDGLFTEKTVYYYQLTKACFTLQFFRWDPTHMSDSAADKSDDYKYNYSNECSISSDKFWLDMGTCDWWNTWTDGTSGISWNTIGDLKHVRSDSTPTAATGRIFFNNSGSAWAADGACAIRAWGGSASKSLFPATCYILNWFEDKDSSSTDIYYGYVDVPLDIEYFQFVLMSEDTYDASVWNYQTSANIEFLASSTQCVYYASGSAKTTITISSGATKDGSARTPLMTKIVEAINTCSDNNVNGYKAYTGLNTTFYSAATSDAKAALATSRGGIEMSIQEHFEAMAYRSINGVTPKIIFFNEGSNGMVETIIIISAITLVAAATFFIIRRKRSI